MRAATLYVLMGLIHAGHAAAPNDTLTIVGGGDVLLHAGLHRQALAHPDGHRSLWWDVENLLQEADIAYLNLEGPMAPGVLASGRQVSDPGNVFDGHVYASYPMFNYHTSLAQDLKSSGVDVVSTANNHSLDRGALGADLTLKALDEAGLAYAGTRARTQLGDGAMWGTVLLYKNWRVAFVACTEHTNGLPDKDKQVALCFGDEERLMQEIEKLSLAAHAVVVTPHWGAEYAPGPSRQQINWANRAFDKGATLVWGTHAHVVQPWGVWRVQDGRRVGVAYSTGNFVSGQFHRQDTRAGLLMRATLVRTGETSQVQHMEAIGLEMVRDERGLHVRRYVEGVGGAVQGKILQERTAVPISTPPEK